MAAEFEQVTPDVLAMANELVRQYHEGLWAARLGFVFRSKSMTVHSIPRAGAISRVPPAIKAQQGAAAVDYVIWISKDAWLKYSDLEKRALIDHELCHAMRNDDGEWTIRGHDVEEFSVIIQRYGLLSYQQRIMAQVMQLHLFEPEEDERGDIVAMSVEAAAAIGEGEGQ
jgi:hypothetical protein